MVHAIGSQLYRKFKMDVVKLKKHEIQNALIL